MNAEIVEQMKAVAKLIDMTDRWKPECVVAIIDPEARAARKAFRQLWKTLVGEPRGGVNVVLNDTLVADLRRFARSIPMTASAGHDNRIGNLMERAADEIERLRGRNKRNAQDLREYAAVLAGEMADDVADESKITVERMV